MNGTPVSVFCAVVTGFVPGELVTIAPAGTLPGYYGTTDIYADDTGCIYLWLPNGTYTFTANGRPCTVTMQNGVGPTGVTVNGQDGSVGTGTGWAYDASTGILSLTGTGPLTLAGANVSGSVRVVVPQGVSSAITLSNLTLRAPGDYQCAFMLETNAVVSLYLAGTNTLASGYLRAGLEVTGGRTLAINHAPGDASGTLTAMAGYAGAGIGGCGMGDAGMATINGGFVTALAGEDFGAGIGGGANGGGGTVIINGGTVTAVSTRLGAGIGTGGYAADQGRDSGTVTINGGTVTAIGGELGHGLLAGVACCGVAADVPGKLVATAGFYQRLVNLLRTSVGGEGGEGTREC
ncbi:MAG: hypothetical protein GX174_13130, partial [Lentisphaerae bacterium]|nr:hypothetical protein [Lentisphaerota bacterium]